MLSASCAGSLESIKLLLGAGADAQRRSPAGRTAAQAARTAGHEECALSIEWHEQRTASAHAAADEKEEVAIRKLAEAVRGGNLAVLQECIAKYGSAASGDALFSASNARDRLRRESTDSAELALIAAQANAETQLERRKPLNEAGAAAAASDEAEASLVALRRAIAELAEQPEPTGTGADRLREARALRDKLADEVGKGAKRNKLQQKREQKRREEEAAAAEVAEEVAMATAIATARREAEELRRVNEQQKSRAEAIAAAESTAVAEAADAAEALRSAYERARAHEDAAGGAEAHAGEAEACLAALKQSISDQTERLHASPSAEATQLLLDAKALRERLTS